MMELVHEYKSFFLLLTVISILLFLLSLLLIPLLLIRIPKEYFIRNKETENSVKIPRGPLKIVVIVFKNLCGWGLMLCGLAMLLLPGQGILTILLSLTLIDFPYKRKFEYYIVSRPIVIQNINRLRKKAGVAPLEID